MAAVSSRLRRQLEPGSAVCGRRARRSGTGCGPDSSIRSCNWPCPSPPSWPASRPWPSGGRRRVQPARAPLTSSDWLPWIEPATDGSAARCDEPGSGSRPRPTVSSCSALRLPRSSQTACALAIVRSPSSRDIRGHRVSIGASPSYPGGLRSTRFGLPHCQLMRLAGGTTWESWLLDALSSFRFAI